jgi:hypothetical protein
MKASVSAALAGCALLGLTFAAVAKSELSDRLEKAAPAASGSVRSVQDELGEAFRKHRPNAAELEKRLAELRASGQTRRTAHLANLRMRFDERLLHDRDVLAELRAHARRQAFLNRAKVVAATELEEPKRSAVLARIDKLLAREQVRYDKRIAKLKLTAQPSSSTSAPAGSAP